MVSRIRLVAVGKVREKHVLEGVREFEKRLKPFCRLETVELKDEGKAKEVIKLAQYLGPGTIILDEKGESFSSEEFAKLIKKQEGALTFIIGGPEGIDDRIKQKSRMISLSRMTFTHEMCRLFLLEQVYRAFMINNNRGYYHK